MSQRGRAHLVSTTVAQSRQAGAPTCSRLSRNDAVEMGSARALARALAENRRGFDGSPLGDRWRPGSDRRGRRSKHARARVLPETNCMAQAEPPGFRSRKADYKSALQSAGPNSLYPAAGRPALEACSFARTCAAAERTQPRWSFSAASSCGHGALRRLRIHPIRVNAVQGQLGGLPDGAFFVGQGQNQRRNGGGLSDGAQRLGYGLTHIAVGVGEQGQQGFGYLPGHVSGRGTGRRSGGPRSSGRRARPGTRARAPGQCVWRALRPPPAARRVPGRGNTPAVSP